MRFSTAYNHRERAKREITCCFSSSVIWGQSHDALNIRIMEIMKTLEKCPTWVAAYIAGYKDCLYQAQWERVEFCYLIDGVWHSTNKDSKRPRVPGESMSSKQSAFLYKNFDKPTFYTEPEVVK